MPNNFALDEFDLVPDHGGRHRIRRTAGHRVREWFLVLTVTVAVTAAGFYGFKIFGDSNNFTAFAPTNSGTEIQTAVQTGPGVTVIDASIRAGQATKVAGQLLNSGFNVLTARNLDGLSIAGGTSASVVYAKTQDVQQKAQDVADKLGGLKVVVDGRFDDPITVVLGTSFK